MRDLPAGYAQSPRQFRSDVSANQRFARPDPSLNLERFVVGVQKASANAIRCRRTGARSGYPATLWSFLLSESDQNEARQSSVGKTSEATLDRLMPSHSSTPGHSVEKFQ